MIQICRIIDLAFWRILIFSGFVFPMILKFIDAITPDTTPESLNLVNQN
jgi:hypothetical protein